MSDSAPKKAEAQDQGLLVVSASPHVREGDSIARIMWGVCLALLPATVFGVAIFGYRALVVIVLSVAASVATEYLLCLWMKRPIMISDGSAVLTGLLLALCLPPSAPWYLPVLGSAAAIGIAKYTAGGLGQNVFNPAHIGRAVLLASYPVAMTAWMAPAAFSSILSGFLRPDVLSSATPLGILKLQGADALYASFGGRAGLYEALFLGNRAGSIGETSTLLLLAGGLVLIAKKWIKWQVPAIMIGSVGLLTWVFGGSAGLFSGDPLLHMMSGGLVLGAFFMATDMVTIPTSTRGQMVFAAGCGLLTVLIRLLGGYPEGVCYSILIMNAFTPLIEKLVRPPKYGRNIPRGLVHAGK